MLSLLGFQIELMGGIGGDFCKLPLQDCSHGEYVDAEGDALDAYGVCRSIFSFRLATHTEPVARWKICRVLDPCPVIF